MSPLAHAPGELSAGGIEISARYGRWRYDADDAVHDTFGLTWARGLAFWKSRLEITGGYALIECPTCTGSVMGGIDFESRLWEHGLPDVTSNPVRTGLSLRLSLGGGKNLGVDHTTAGSAAIAVPLDIAFPLGRSALVALSAEPGVGYGHIASTDFGNGGLLPMFGGAVSVRVGPRVEMHIGMQRVIIDGGPTMVGAALSWQLR
jgi:hypothetical protein